MMKARGATSETAVWQWLRQRWCQHRQTAITPRNGTMPAHVVCQSCGWRDSIIAAPPKATRTWDSTRDEARYEREKQRRAAVEQQRQLAVAQLAMPAQKFRSRRSRPTDVVEMKRLAGE